MPEQNGYLKMKTFIEIVGITVTVLIVVFSFVFSDIAGNAETCQNHIQTHSMLERQLGEIITNQKWMIDEIKKINLKINQ